jgi:prepilin-type processing-associated H-X9-DG protein
MPTTNPPGHPFLNQQEKHGGVAGLFSLIQAPEGVDSAGRPLGNRAGYFGSPSSGIGRYAPGYNQPPQSGSDVPLMRDYLSGGLQTLVCPNDKEDWYWAPSTVNFNARWATRNQSVGPQIPLPPGSERDVVSYNISYLYIAGLKSEDSSVLFPPPIFGDETATVDLATNAWYGYNWATNAAGTEPQTTLTEVGFNPQTGYAKIDNHSDRGGNFVFADGSGSFVDKNPQAVFFSSPDDDGNVPGNFGQSSKSINLLDADRSNKVMTID